MLLLEASTGLPYGRIAEHLARTRTGVLQRSRIIGADYRRRPWTTREDDDLRRSVAAGVPFDEIAEQHVRTPNAVRVRACNLGLTRKESK